jgi:Kef-type K+ transport system membrane component KefB
MSQVNTMDGVRGAALDRIDKSERNYKIAFFGAAVVETLFVVSFLLLADLSNRMHVLLLLSTVAVYTIIAFGLIALGSYTNRNTLRVLKAIELLENQLAVGRR